jgi:hypothetical protein
MFGIFSQVQGWLKIKGDTDGTKIGNVADALKIHLASLSPSAMGDFFLEVSRGNIPGMSGVSKFGFNDRVSSVNTEDVWDGSNIYTFPTVDRTVNLASTSPNDTVGGTGAEHVRLDGLSLAYAPISEVVLMNGTADVLSANSYLRLPRMTVIKAGSSDWNEGDITATSTVDNLLLAQITELQGQTLMALDTIPAGKTAYLIEWAADVDTRVVASIMVRPFGEAFQTKRKIITSVPAVKMWKPYLEITEKSDIRVLAESATGNNEVGSYFNYILVDN